MTGECARFLAAGILGLLVVAAAGEAGAQAGRRELRRRTITIDDQSITSLPEIHVAGGAGTVITFQVPVLKGGAMASEALFHSPSEIEKAVIVVPKADLTAPAALNISLADGTVLSFKCVSLPNESDAQVDVVLALAKRAAPDSARALRATIEQLRNERDECLAGSASTAAAKVATLFLAENLDEPRIFDRRAFRGGDKQNRLLVQARWVYRLAGVTYMLFTVENRDGEAPWSLDRAEVRLGSGKETMDLKVIAATAELAVLQPDVEERVVVAFQAPPELAGQRVTVTLHERGGARRVVLSGLTP